jgi:hypothetical protein
MNLAFELNLWNSLEIQLDYFTEKRSNILQERSYIPTTMGLQDNPSSNIGKASGKGIDMSVDYNKSFNKDIFMVLRGNFTYASSKFDVFEEPDYINAPRRTHKGRKISQEEGFVAERLFLDEQEVANSPRQFDQYLAGDIKYKDINGDMQIDDNDLVPIGYPTTPEIIYGFGVSFGYKNLDFSCFFQGSARSSFWIDAEKSAPFIGTTGNRAMLQYWADSHWSEDDRNIHAMWPRLSETVNVNNTKRSTWFMRDGSFLRLKTAEIGYSLPHKWISNAKLGNVRFYVSGNNLLLFSKFKSSANIRIIKDLLESGQLTKIRYVPHSLGLDELFAPYVSSGIVELYNLPDEVLIPHKFNVDGVVESTNFRIDLEFPATDAPAGTGLQNVYKYTMLARAGSVVFALPTAYQFNADEYKYLKFKIYAQDASMFQGSYDPFRRVYFRFMNYLWGFASTENIGFGQQMWDSGTESFKLTDAQLKKWEDITIPYANAVGKHTRVIILTMGCEANATFPSTPDMVFYVANFRFTKEP